MVAQTANSPHTITSSLGSQPLSHAINRMTENQDRKRMVAVSLARLAAHYWRPDFTAIQAELLFEDFVADLTGFSNDEIETACRLYRQNGKNQFFPKPGQLREIALAQRKDAAGMDRISKRPLTEPRPLLWWLQSRERWEPHWHESQIPADEQARYRDGQARRQQQARQSDPPPYVPGTR